MKCQNCGRNDANFNYTRIINGYKNEVHLCSECARKLNVNFDFDFNNVFSDVFDSFSRIGSFAMPRHRGIGLLGDGLNDFISDSFFNPESFFGDRYIVEDREDELDKTLSNIQKKYGKKNETKENLVKDKKQNEIKQLKAKMQEYIKNEEYEKAAVLRDKIKELEK